jgi:hypothetical protein
MRKLETILFQTLIFLIPSNLAYHWILDKSYVTGILVDYRIPKLYLSDMLIIGLIFWWVLKNAHKVGLEKLKQKITNNRAIASLIAGMWLLFTAKSLTSDSPLITLWFIGKLLELGLFTGYIYSSFTKKSFLEAVQTPLSVALIVQASIGLYQVIQQKSLAGYWLLGEPILRSGSNLSRGIIDNGIKILPYGTTPHPNVLAGFCSIGLLFLLLCIQNNPKQMAQRILSLTAIGLSVPIIILTQSLTGVISFLVGIILICVNFNVSNRILSLLFSLLFMSNILFILLMPSSINHSKAMIANTSFSRRYELITYGKQAFLTHPLIGTGLNNSIVASIEFGRVTANTAFLQPIHNIYILWLVETGLVGYLGLLVSALSLGRSIKSTNGTSSALAPLAALLLIGLSDHYPLTLQSGQIMLSLALVFPTLSHKQ